MVSVSHMNSLRAHIDAPVNDKYSCNKLSSPSKSEVTSENVFEWLIDQTTTGNVSLWSREEPETNSCLATAEQKQRRPDAE